MSSSDSDEFAFSAMQALEKHIMEHQLETFMNQAGQNGLKTQD